MICFKPLRRLDKVARCFILSLFLFVPNAHAEGFNIVNANALFNQSSLAVDAQLDLSLSDAVEEALHNGISITLLMTLDLYKSRKYRWDERIARWPFRHHINYHSLSDRYVLTNHIEGESHSYASLVDLFNEIESFSFRSEILGETLPSSKHGYKLHLKIAIDKAALPAPLRVSSYIFPAWRVKSETHEWFIDN
ncbi:MAG: DUF4390 domain-containing protein [Arenicellales bacterium]